MLLENMSSEFRRSGIFQKHLEQSYPSQLLLSDRLDLDPGIDQLRSASQNQANQSCGTQSCNYPSCERCLYIDRFTASQPMSLTILPQMECTTYASSISFVIGCKNIDGVHEAISICHNPMELDEMIRRRVNQKWIDTGIPGNNKAELISSNEFEVQQKLF